MPKTLDQMTRSAGSRIFQVERTWRAIVVWTPSLLVFVVSIHAFAEHTTWQPWLALALLSLLTAVSVALPRRGLPDYFAGTWPGPR